MHHHTRYLNICYYSICCCIVMLWLDDIKLIVEKLCHEILHICIIMGYANNYMHIKISITFATN